jgi:hypothetical protein
MEESKFVILIFSIPSAALSHWVTDWIILDATNALKSDATPGADESYRYHEVGLSQQVWAILSETSSP